MNVYRLSKLPSGSIHIFSDRLFRIVPEETCVLILDNEDAIENMSCFYPLNLHGQRAPDYRDKGLKVLVMWLYKDMWNGSH